MYLQMHTIKLYMLNPTSKYFKVKNWHLGFYSIQLQTEMLYIRHNDLSLEILFHFEFTSCIYIYMKRVAIEM